MWMHLVWVEVNLLSVPCSLSAPYICHAPLKQKNVPNAKLILKSILICRNEVKDYIGLTRFGGDGAGKVPCVS
ncbi:hypothetical protein KC19_VG316400 [Ceratodon purpureus]|uniref:Secreted protein n=1 Tax=Ceratodon purpureus TaxID=3225 RepID=A0A8T0HVJ3_CERPU|nr:hypothetical protein KC19_VG316400 [Ceratodon purpureus]